MDKKFIAFFILFHILILNFPPGAAETVDETKWPQFGHDAAHTGYSPTTAPTTNQLFLHKQLSSGSTIDASNSGVVIVDEKLYVGFSNGLFICCNAYNGTTIWNIQPGMIGNFSGIPAVVDGRVYIGAGNNLVCFNAETGQVLWSFPAGGTVKGSPTVFGNKIYFGSYENKKIYCVSTTGVKSWDFTAEETISSGPAVADGKVYVVASYQSFLGNSYIYCLDAATGNQIWRYSDRALATTCTVVDGKVYVGFFYTLSCLDAIGHDGTTDLLWSYSVPGEGCYLSSPAVSNGRVYIGTWAAGYGYDKMFCVNADNGSKLWEYQIESISAAPALADDKVYIAAHTNSIPDENYIYCFDAIGNENGTTNLIWKNTTQYTGRGQPAIANSRVWFITDKTYVYGFGQNHPPSTPDTPSGPIEGLVGEELTYSTKTTDPDDDQIFYQWQMGEVTTGWDGPFASGENCQQTYGWNSAGTYDVKVKAKDNYNEESDWSSPLLVIVSPLLSYLDIEAPSSVIEQASFFITVTANGAPVANAIVQFATETSITDSTGRVSLTAPSVEQHTLYTITASLAGYRSATKSIAVLNQNKQENEAGWIFGAVSDYDTSSPLSAVHIVISSGEKSWSASTNEEGKYVVSLPIGTYTVTASKVGFEPSTKSDIPVEKKSAIEENFILEIAHQPPPTPTSMNYIDYLIQQQGFEGTIGARMDVNHPLEKSIFYYSDALAIDLTATNKTVSCTVSADNGTNGTILVIRIGEGVLADLDNLNVTYDGISINEWNDIAAFFDMNSNTDPGWLRVLTTTGLYIFIRVPHFSEHRITISSLVRTFEGSMIVILYISFAILASIVIFSPRLKNIIRRELYLRMKR